MLFKKSALKLRSIMVFMVLLLFTMMLHHATAIPTPRSQENADDIKKMVATGAAPFRTIWPNFKSGYLEISNPLWHFLSRATKLLVGAEQANEECKSYKERKF